MGGRRSNLLRQFLFQSPQRIAYFRLRRQWLRARDKKNLEQHIAEIIWYRAKTKSAPKLKIKKSGDGEGKVSYFGVSDAKRRAARDRPHTKLSYEKKEKGEITKKKFQKRNRSQQKKQKLLSQNKATPST